jgi:hypothetical protein
MAFSIPEASILQFLKVLCEVLVVAAGGRVIKKHLG